MSGVFISYRRTDSDVAAGRLADDLSEILGPARVFRDVDSLEAGEDFPRALDRALDSCAACIALIGSRWSNAVNDKGERRLDDPKDWVRLEIARALERDIRVIPVLVSTTMPKELELPPDLAPLLRRHAVELTDRHWKQDVEGLAQALERIPGFGTRAVPPVPARAVALRPVLAASAVLVVLLAAGAWLVWRPGNAAPAAAAAVEPTPTAAPIDLSPGVRIRDTGTEGAVAGLVTAMAMEASLAHQKRPVTLSARYLYEKAKTIDRFGIGTEGTDMSATLHVAETYGAPPEDRWPYVAGSRALPKGVTWASMDEEAGKYRARTFRLAGYDDIAGQLAQGRPVLGTIDVTSAWSTDEAYKTGVIKPTEQDKDIAGSVIAIVRFDPADGSIRFAHSWGVSWGDNGFGRLSAADAKKALHELWAIEVPRTLSFYIYMDPFSGHWVIDLPASQFAGPVPAEWTQDIAASADGLRARERVVAGNGAVSEYSLEARFDGAEYPVIGSPLVDTMSYARPDLRRIDGAGHKGGSVVFVEVIVVSADGQALTMALAIPRPDGTTAEAVLVFRQAGPPVDV